MSDIKDEKNVPTQDDKPLKKELSNFDKWSFISYCIINFLLLFLKKKFPQR